MTKAQIKLPPKMQANFLQPAKHRVFKGGRGSGKTRGAALMSAIYGYRFAEAGREGVLLASREHLNSLEESSLEEIKTAIKSVDWLNDYYDIGEKYVRTKNRRVSYAFAGLRHNLDSIKSKANILLNWTDEAEGVSEPAWRKLIPTIRGGTDLENWLTYNPESPESATHKRFVETSPTNCIVTTINWRDNPWWKQSGLEAERLDDQRLRPDTYDHVWEGAFLTLTEAQVFGGKFVVDEFEPDGSFDGPYQGLDFGFAQDPTAAVRCYIKDRVLYIRNEAGKVKLELDDTAGFLCRAIPEFEKYATRADSARPESISYLKRPQKGDKAAAYLPRMESVKKWAGSVEDGVEFIKSFEKVVIHPDCQQVAREFRLYSFKIDRLSGDILPVIVDANNHYIDALRYALVPLMKRKAASKVVVRL
ncbi:MAG: putative terminase large subunit [Prokaryotic dsDNA virus sp.]|jgi:phage terminase large subunit|nr:MAG: putative terminase large subunit [Prokaryotic dsDNA virus sp.]|tara:strand:- start:5244 stop:6500 length:1257 start_codon:yes stop_codon:yes gene_type:complete